MSEENSEPGVTSLKLSDLTAAKQQVLTGAAITLTTAGLVAVAAASIGALLPAIGDFAPGARPALVYIAAVALPLAGYQAYRAARFSSEWSKALLDRLASRSSPPDQVSDELQDVFVSEIKRGHRSLSHAQKLLLFGILMLLTHAYLAVTMPLLSPKGLYLAGLFKPWWRALWPSGTSEAAMFYYMTGFSAVMIVGGTIWIDPLTAPRNRRATP